MLAVFRPVRNAYWFEIREVYVWKKKIATKAQTISDYVWTMWEFPVFKPLVACSSKKDSLKHTIYKNTL